MFNRGRHFNLRPIALLGSLSIAPPALLGSNALSRRHSWGWCGIWMQKSVILHRSPDLRLLIRHGHLQCTLVTQFRCRLMGGLSTLGSQRPNPGEAHHP